MSGLTDGTHAHDADDPADTASVSTDVPVEHPAAVYPENKECPSCYTCVPSQASSCAYCSYDFA